ncbi:MAG: glycosyltransferase [Sphingobium sp.]
MGGMEAHCHLLIRALAAHGHQVVMFASGDSDPALPLRPITPRHYEAVLPWDRWHGTDELTAFQEAAFASAWAAIREEGFDVVHNNSMHAAIHDWARRDRQPMVTSLHVPPFAGLASALERNGAPWLRQTVTSQAHQACWWDMPPATASVVYNGIDPSDWTFSPNGNGRAIWVGRITPNKGTHIAIDAARAAGLPLDIIGPVDCADYHAREIAPRLGEDCVHHGAMKSDDLVVALRAASVMLMTPMWDEPFGLVAAEALACGVPVAALDRGAMREVIGDAGALAAGPDQLPAAIMRALVLPRAACRARVERLFTVGGMIARYEDAYAAAMSAAADASSCASSEAVLA